LRTIKLRQGARKPSRTESFDSRHLAAIVRSSEDAIVTTTLSGEVSSWSPGAELIFGYRADELIGKPIDVLIPHHREGEEVALMADLFMSRDGVARTETERIARDGSLVPIALTITAIRDEEGGAVGLSLIARDVIERKVLEVEADYLHRYDQLTGLYTRREFEHLLRRQLPYSRRYGCGGAVLLLDVDGVANRNADLRRGDGGELLTHVARLLTNRLRTTDTVGRLGADRFAVLLPEATEGDARTVADDLVARLATHLAPIAGRRRPVSCNIGVACFDNGAPASADELISTADSAVRFAKLAGGDRVVCARATRDSRHGAAIGS